MQVQAPLILNIAAEKGVVVAQMRAWLLRNPQFHVEVQSHSDMSTFSILHRSIGFVVSIENAAIPFEKFEPIFYQASGNIIHTQIQIGLGQRVSGGMIVPAVRQLFLQFSDTIGTVLCADSVLWTPAELISSFSYFSETVARYTSSGPFPVLPLIRFSTAKAGEIATVGMSEFGCQEIVFVQGVLDRTAAVQRMIRIADDLIRNGAITEPIEFAGLAENERISATPSGDGRY
jgi:hypothetical protein